MSATREGFSDYTQTPRSDGYRGYRIALTVGGEPVRRYYRPEDEASALDDWQRLRKQQRALGTDRRRAGGTRHRNGFAAEAETGICGLRLGFAIDRDGLGRPELSLGLMVEGRIVGRSRRVGRTRSIESAWDELTRELALLQGMARRPSAWLAVPVPSVDQFVALAKVKRRSGQRIDEVALGELVEREGAGV